MASKGKAEKKQHIQVFTRVRPLSSQELRSQVVVECMNSREVSVRDKAQTKTFTFDRVFGPDSKQVDVYKSVVNPLIEEVLQGYNCTVFAYGQTGTGKTYTMVGEKAQAVGISWEDDPNCGIIPRTLSHLFDELKIRAEEFTVRVSFLELYNEELCDLLAPNDNDDSKSLRLFEDSSRKGSVIVSGLEERTVHNKDDVYAILAAGNLRRQTASTLMNAQSSRSHTIFTITVHIKVTTPEGEDLIKTGKLNLVDLAGSENIGRSGAVDMRAREAGNINQSLLTLGRVITSLVERTPHVPYRESKLTRILQDSLGGRTKTSIIATVSPAFCNLEETLSTFDYAHRARNITNKPEINQKTSKRALIKEYTEEIERLRRDLIAAREKHGVYLAPENYNAIMAERDHLNRELIAKLQLLKAREDEKAEQDEALKKLNDSLNATLTELQKTQKLCDEKENKLIEANKEAVVLFEKAVELDSDKNSLHDKLDRSRRIQEYNLEAADKFKNQLCSNLSDSKTRDKKFLSEIVPQIQGKINFDRDFVKSRENDLSNMKTQSENLIQDTKNKIQTALDVNEKQFLSLEGFFKIQQQTLETDIEAEKQRSKNLENFFNQYHVYMGNSFKKLTENSGSVMDHSKVNLKNLESVKGQMSNYVNLLPMMPDVWKGETLVMELSIKKNEMKMEEILKKEEECSSREDELEKELDRLQEQLILARGEVKNLRNEKKYLKTAWKQIHEENEKLRKQLSDQANVNIFNSVNNLSKEMVKTEELIATTAESINSIVIKNSEESMKIIDDVQTFEGNSTARLIESQNAIAECFVEKCEDLSQQFQSRRDEIHRHAEDIKTPLTESVETLEKYENDSQDFIAKQNTALKNFQNDSQEKQQKILSNVTEYVEESFSNSHGREREIKLFFEEGIQKDEKTGNTPQRKEFNISKRMNILKVRNENEGN